MKVQPNLTRPPGRLGLVLWLLLLSIAPARAQEIRSGTVIVRAVRDGNGFAGFDLLADRSSAAVVRLSSARVKLIAHECSIESNSLVFSKFTARAGSGLRLGERGQIRARLRPDELYPEVSFALTIESFDPAKWKSTVGSEPFHFLAVYLGQAEAWHQRGWLDATPLADRFPLLLDRHAGTPEISAYHYNRNWSYTPPLGAHPLPVIGLWAPRQGHYVGFEFQTARLRDNSEKDIATGYRWEDSSHAAGADAGQFVALVYPFGGQGYQQLAWPSPGAKLTSRCTLLWSLNLPATSDPNRFVWSFLWPRLRNELPRAPAVPDVSWIPGGIRQRDFPGPPRGGLIGGVEKPFQVAGSKLIYGWTWHNEIPVAAAVRSGDTNTLEAIEKEGRQLLALAKRFRVEGDDCLFWEKPLTGRWTETWGGSPVTSLHNANGFAAGRLFLGLYRDAGQTEFLPVIDGIFNWAKHIAWTRNEFADVPSSPFAIGGTLSASFCLDYYRTFKDSHDPAHRRRAETALDLARSFTYRYLVMWPSDNNRADNLDSSFLWEPNSGRDWTGAACANEVFWNLDTLAQTAVHTGDPVLMWALQGSLSRWHLLYQPTIKSNLAEYQASDMTEGYGLYPGTVYGVGRRAPYGFAAPLVMTEPVGNAALRVLAGEKAALAFKKGNQPFEISAYHFSPPANFRFAVHLRRPDGGIDTNSPSSVTEPTRARVARFDLALTAPYIDLSDQPVRILRSDQSIELKAGRDFLRPPQALWSLYLKNVQPEDQIEVGGVDPRAPELPSAPPLSGNQPGSSAAKCVPLPYDTVPSTSWQDADGWAGLPRTKLWAFNVPFQIAPGPKCAVTKAVPFAPEARPAGQTACLFYADGPGQPPSLVFTDGARAQARQEALAWRAWPAIYKARLLVTEIPLEGKRIAGLDPGQRLVWAMTVLKGSGRGRSKGSETGAAFRAGVLEWSCIKEQETKLSDLAKLAQPLPPAAIAILPPNPRGAAFEIVQRAGLIRHALVLSPRQLVDPEVFNARRLPVAFYLDGEDYAHTVQSAGDGAAAIVTYLKEGGALVLLASQPWPLFYAAGPGFHRAEPLTEKLGLPLQMAFETAPGEPLTLSVNQDKPWWRLPPSLAYPPGDPRLRSIDRGRLPSGCHYTPLVTVLGQSGRNYGDAAGILGFPGGGQIFYVASILQQGPDHGFDALAAALRFAIDKVRRDKRRAKD